MTNDMFDAVRYLDALDAVNVLKSHGIKVRAVTFKAEQAPDIVIAPPLTAPTLLAFVCYGYDGNTRFFQAKLNGCRVLWEQSLSVWAHGAFAKPEGGRYAH